MISKTKINNGYLGPKAIFDPNYIPPVLLFRKKEENSLFSILNDSFADRFSLNILYQGINGIGKKVIINKILKDLKLKNRDSALFQKVIIDCKEKNIDELLFSLLSELNKFPQFKLNLESLYNSNLSHLWNVIKLACRKINESLILIFNNIESIEPIFLRKLLHLGKEIKVTIISTANKILKASTYEFLTEFDIRKKLNYFTFKQLNLILQKRANLAFPYEIDKNLIYFVTDLIFEHFVPVPGKGIDIFREIYPLLKGNEHIEHYKMLEICQNQFDTFQITDEFNLFNYISEEDPLMLIFLDNLSNTFLKKNNYYISINDLKEIYQISCEALEYEKNLNEFYNLIGISQKVGILSPSKRMYKEKQPDNFSEDYRYNYFFMIINPYQLKAFIDAIFNNA